MISITSWGYAQCPCGSAKQPAKANEQESVSQELYWDTLLTMLEVADKEGLEVDATTFQMESTKTGYAGSLKIRGADDVVQRQARRRGVDTHLIFIHQDRKSARARNGHYIAHTYEDSRGRIGAFVVQVESGQVIPAVANLDLVSSDGDPYGCWGGIDITEVSVCQRFGCCDVAGCFEHAICFKF